MSGPETQKQLRAAKSRLAQIASKLERQSNTKLQKERSVLEKEILLYEHVTKGLDLPALTDLCDLGRLLVSLRLAKYSTQEGLANLLGVSGAQVGRDEAGHYKGITVARAARILKALGAEIRLTVSFSNKSRAATTCIVVDHQAEMPDLNLAICNYTVVEKAQPKTIQFTLTVTCKNKMTGTGEMAMRQREKLEKEILTEFDATRTSDKNTIWASIGHYEIEASSSISEVLDTITKRCFDALDQKKFETEIQLSEGQEK